MALVETQPILRNKVMLLVVPVIVFAAVVSLVELRTEPEALPWILLPFLFFGLILSARMRTHVTATEVRIAYWPLWRRTIPLVNVRGAEAVSFRPILEHGGWGIRYGKPGVWVYTVHGRRGVRLHLSGHRDVLIGSQEPETLLAELEARGVQVK